MRYSWNLLSKSFLSKDTRGDAQAYALQHGQGCTNRSAVEGDLSPYGCSYGVSNDNQLKLPPDHILPAGLNLHTNVYWYKFYTVDAEQKKRDARPL